MLILMAIVDKNFKEKVEMLVEYILKNMKDKDDWAQIKYRNVPNITGVSSSICKKDL